MTHMRAFRQTLLGNRSGNCPACEGATHWHDCPITALLDRLAAITEETA